MPYPVWLINRPALEKLAGLAGQNPRQYPLVIRFAQALRNFTLQTPGFTGKMACLKKLARLAAHYSDQPDIVFCCADGLLHLAEDSPHRAGQKIWRMRLKRFLKKHPAIKPYFV